MKITKEVKTFAEREFNSKVNEARNKFFAPKEAREKEIRKDFEKLVSQMNEMLFSFRKEHNEAFIYIDAGYRSEDNEIRIGNVNLKEKVSFKEPDKIRFMAELSMGEDLADISKLIEKYFA